MSRLGEQLVQVGTYGDGSPKWITRRHLAKFGVAEKQLGYTLTVLQGCSHPGVGASGGTHDRKDVADLAPYDWENKCRVLRQVADTAYHRVELAGVWPEHVHTGDLGGQDMAPLLESQAKGYVAGRDGLGPWPFGVDTQWRPSPLVTRWKIGWGIAGTLRPSTRRHRVDLSKVTHQAKVGGLRRNPGVRVIQQALNASKRISAGLTVDGHYGPSTKAAYRKWQLAVGYGPKTATGEPDEASLKRLSSHVRSVQFLVSK